MKSRLKYHYTHDLIKAKSKPHFRIQPSNKTKTHLINATAIAERMYKILHKASPDPRPPLRKRLYRIPKSWPWLTSRPRSPPTSRNRPLRRPKTQPRSLLPKDPELLSLPFKETNKRGSSKRPLATCPSCISISGRGELT